MLKSKRTRRQSGFTLVELGIVLALIGIGLFFAITKMQETGNTSRAQNAATEISSTITNIQRFYGTASAFPAEVPSKDLIANKLVPVRWVSGTDVVGPFGTSIAVASASGTSEATMTITKVPPGVCLEMVRMLADGMKEIKAGEETVKPSGGVIDLSKISTGCAQAKTTTTKSDPSVVLTFVKT